MEGTAVDAKRFTVEGVSVVATTCEVVVFKGVGVAAEEESAKSGVHWNRGSPRADRCRAWCEASKVCGSRYGFSKDNAASIF